MYNEKNSRSNLSTWLLLICVTCALEDLEKGLLAGWCGPTKNDQGQRRLVVLSFELLLHPLSTLTDNQTHRATAQPVQK
eukprot:5408134-Amphidinium_carterae.1